VETAPGKNRLDKFCRRLGLGATTAFSLALMLNAAAVAWLIVTIRSTVYLMPEVAIAALAGSALAILGALILRPMTWRFRVVLFSAVVFGVIAGTYVWSGSDALEDPWPNSFPAFNRFGQFLAGFDATRFFWTSVVAIVGAAMALIGGALAGKWIFGLLRRRLRSRVIGLVAVAAFLMLLYQVQTYVSSRGWFLPSPRMQVVALAVAAVTLLTVLSAMMYWTRSGVVAAIGMTAVILSGTILLVTTSPWFDAGRDLLITGRVIWAVVSMSAFTTVFIASGLLLRMVAREPKSISRPSGGTGMALAISPAIAIVIAGWQFSGRWDTGALLRDHDWVLAGALAEAKMNGACVGYAALRPQIGFSGNADPAVLERLFHRMGKTNAFVPGDFHFHHLRPGIDFSFLHAGPVPFADPIAEWVVVDGEVDENQLAALCGLGKSVSFFGGVNLPSTFSRKIVVKGVVQLWDWPGESVERFLNIIGPVNSSCRLMLYQPCENEQDEKRLVDRLEKISRIQGINRCTYQVVRMNSSNSGFTALANEGIDWAKFDLQLTGSVVPLEAIRRILASAGTSSLLIGQSQLDAEENYPLAVRMMLAWPVSYSCKVFQYFEDLRQLDAVKSLNDIDRFGCWIRGEADGVAQGAIVLRSSWLDKFSDDEVRQTRSLVLGGEPNGGLDFWNDKDIGASGTALLRFSQLQELHCGRTGMRDLDFLQAMPELRRLQLHMVPTPDFMVPIRNNLPALKNLEELVLIGNPPPQIMPTIQSLPSLRSLVVLSPEAGTNRKTEDSIRTMLPNVNVQFAPLDRYLEHEPEIMKAHRQRLREQLERESVENQ